MGSRSASERGGCAVTGDRTLAGMAGLYAWPRVVAVTGALGSGKTEFVLNLARGLKELGDRVTIADADIINPYFCIRQVSDQLEREGFAVLTPPEEAKWSDMSVLNPGISRAIVDDRSRLILDIGGDAVGVRALTQFAPDIVRVGYRLLLVVNAFRPTTGSPEGIARMRTRMESLCGLEVGALVANCHLMEATTAADVADGVRLVREAGERLGLPVLYATVLPELYDEAERLLKDVAVPLWPMTRFMRRPWEGESMWSAPVRPEE